MGAAKKLKKPPFRKVDQENDKEPFMAQFVEDSSDHNVLASEFTTGTVGGADERDDHREVI